MTFRERRPGSHLAGKWPLLKALFALTMLMAAILPVSAQIGGYKSQEVDDDGIPVIVKHLPDWKKTIESAFITNSSAELRAHLGERKVLSSFELDGGGEAVTAPYPEGRLLIVEFTTPQAATAADAAITAAAPAEPSPVIYKRIGNYSVFVFDPTDRDAAAKLIDQVKYEKSVQWLGEDPYLVRRIERYLVGTSADVLFSTVIFIVLCLAGSLLAGAMIGLVYFRVRGNKRSRELAYSDAGGLTRLNLDGLTETCETDPKGRLSS